MTETQIRNKVVSTAKAWIGYNEADGSHKQIVDVYNSHKPLARSYALKYTDAWCAGYVSAVAIKCGLTDIMPTEVGVWNMIELYRKLGRWMETDSYAPKPGDVIMYAWGDNGVGDCTNGASHVGIVVSCDGKKITVIEGNKNNAVEYREIAVNGRYIRGFGLPDYGSKATEADAPTPTPQPETVKGVVNVEVRMLRKGMVGNDCRAAMLILKDKGYYPDAIPSTDNIFGPKMDAAVRQFQRDNNLSVDGIIGEKTWAALLNSAAKKIQETTNGGTVNMELRILSKGMTGNDVHAAMVLLKDKGYYPYTIPASDKTFGAKMDAGVRKMQTEHGLGTDGIIGQKSWTFLLK